MLFATKWAMDYTMTSEIFNNIKLAFEIGNTFFPV